MKRSILGGADALNSACCRGFGGLLDGGHDVGVCGCVDVKKAGNCSTRRAMASPLSTQNRTPGAACFKAGNSSG